MPGPDPALFLAAGVLAYGPGPGVELIPYFLGLAAWAGLAVAAVLLSPITALLRRLRRRREKKDEGRMPKDERIRIPNDE